MVQGSASKPPVASWMRKGPISIVYLNYLNQIAVYRKRFGIKTIKSQLV
jgi:hypothetical protein